MRYGEQKLLAEKIGVRPSYLNDILKRRRSCSARLAAVLEVATGIDRRAWLYPEEFPNPFLVKKEANLSMSTLKETDHETSV